MSDVLHVPVPDVLSVAKGLHDAGEKVESLHRRSYTAVKKGGSGMPDSVHRVLERKLTAWKSSSCNIVQELITHGSLLHTTVKQYRQQDRL